MMSLSKNKKTEEMMNINDLPDEILTHILSFLPMKHAFRTTIVSKKWQHLCHSLSVLNIIDEGVDDDIIYWTNFRQFMNTVMLCPCSQYITLKSLHLECDYDLRDPKAEAFSLNTWITAAKQRGIEYLNLHLFEVFLMPITLFYCKTLVVLKLTYMRVANMYRCSVDLPSLKTLDLNSVSFHDMENLMRLISGCPVLENLRTVNVEARAGLAAGGYFKPLSKLINADIHSFVVPLRAVSNVQFLCLFENRKIIYDEKINSYYKDFSVFGNLTELELQWTFRDTHDWDEVVKMLHNCPKLQTLIIIKGRNSTTGDNWKYPYDVPECVSSHLTTCHIADFEAFNYKDGFQFAKYILQNAKFLRDLAIFPVPRPIEPQFVEDLFSCPRISPACMPYVCGFS